MVDSAPIRGDLADDLKQGREAPWVVVEYLCAVRDYEQMVRWVCLGEIAQAVGLGGVDLGKLLLGQVGDAVGGVEARERRGLEVGEASRNELGKLLLSHLGRLIGGDLLGLGLAEVGDAVIGSEPREGSGLNVSQAGRNELGKQ